MRYQPERALTLVSICFAKLLLQFRRNEVLAREGIDTPHISGYALICVIHVEMRYQPERALTQCNFTCVGCYTYNVEMRYQPERALTQVAVLSSVTTLFVEMRYQPERALTLFTLSVKNLRQSFFSRNEVLAREGIDTVEASRLSITKTFFVEMRYQPERALTQQQTEGPVCSADTCRNEVLAREGIDTISPLCVFYICIKVEMRYQPERALTLKTFLVVEVRRLTVEMRYQPERALTP